MIHFETLRLRFWRVNREWFAERVAKAVEGHRTPRRFRVHHAPENFRQVLECDRPCGAFRDTQFNREPSERRKRGGNASTLLRLTQSVKSTLEGLASSFFVSLLTLLPPIVAGSILLLSSGCACFTSAVTERELSNGTVERVTVVKVSTLMDSKRELAKLSSGQTDKGQKVSIDALSLESSATNAVNLVESVVGAAAHRSATVRLRHRCSSLQK